MNADVKSALTLVGGMTLALGAAALVIRAINKARGPSGQPGVWVYLVAPDGNKFASSIAPDSGDNWVWKWVGRSFASAEEARAAAIAEIKKSGGTPREFQA